jgi:DNA helicase-2/ATP-dependent DNA helicase PcrA
VKAYFNDRDLQEADAMSKKPRMGNCIKIMWKNVSSRRYDFDDLLLKTNELLTRFPEVLQIPKPFSLYLVDEYPRYLLSIFDCACLVR